jgi:Flp pilus assembly protein TadG
MARLINIFSHWRTDQRGVTAISVSLIIMPVLVVLSLATDYALVTRQRSALQHIVDAAAIAMARDSDIGTLSPGQVNTRATQYAQAMASTTPVEGLNVSATVSATEIHIDAGGNVRLNFGAFLGQDTMAVSTAVTVQRAIARSLEVALALDNTGSMNDAGKIVELKKAVKAMVAYLNDPSRNQGQIKMAMVPFNTNVRINPAHIATSYLYRAPPMGWDGCITDRDAGYNTNDTPPQAGVDASKFHWGIWRWLYGSWDYWPVACGSLAQMIPLTTNLLSIDAAVDGLVAGGATNVTIGVEWGLHALTASEPLSQAAADGTPNLVKALILLTDGMNTADRFGDNNGGQIDQRTLEACTSAKAKGLTLFVIRLIDGNATLLQSCASASENYFDVSDATQLTPLFENISTQLNKLRISK